MLHFPSPIAHRGARTAAALIAAALVAFVAWPRPQAVPVPAAVEIPIADPAPPMTPAPSPAPPEIASGTSYLAGELSLQETLDRLGYTVNVPRSYAGHSIYQWNSDRVSDRSDAVQAKQFEATGSVDFAVVSEQSYFGSRSILNGQTDGGAIRSILAPTGKPGLWLSPDAGSDPTDLSGRFELYIKHPGNDALGPDTDRPLYSNPAENPGGGTQLLVLPAKTGGTWVWDGTGVGHWRGGHNTGAYLLCWDDTPNGDRDYQDIVIAAHGLQPVR